MEKLQSPLGFGEILDVTFRTLKDHFAKLFMIMVVLVGPIILLQNIILLLEGNPLLGESILNEGSFLNPLTYMETEPTYYLDWLPMSFYILTVIILIGVAYIMAAASVILAVHHLREGRAFDLKDLIRQAGSRYWALLGGSIVYVLAVGGIFMLVAMIYILIGSAVSLLDNSIFKSVTIWLTVILGLIGVFYHMTRWSFYFASVLFEKVSPGISKSWNLTRNQFLRLMGLYIVLTIILTIITMVLQYITYLLFGNAVLSGLILYIIEMLTLLIFFVAYTIVYYDLLIRNEAADLKEMVDTYHTGEDMSLSDDAGSAQLER
ncbi:MAG: hypothetical protein H0Z33_06630 [Bacillaceae bacterium]|nr:hypothetical protein [Bacillaceae bacterium]